MAAPDHSAIISTIYEGEVRYLQRRSHAAVAFQSRVSAAKKVERGVFLTTDAVAASVVSHGADGQVRFPAHTGGAKEGQLCPQNGVKGKEEGRPLVADPYDGKDVRGLHIREWDIVADGEGFHLRLRVDPTFFLGISNGEPVLSNVPAVWYWGEPSSAVLRAALRAAWQGQREVEEVVDPVAVGE